MSENLLSRCGYVAIVGRPNVGKSTLLNHLLGQKISITSRRPQTTRHRILGIKTVAAAQIVYVDTPGLHLHGKKAMSQYLNRAASSILRDVDLILFIVDRTVWSAEDQWVLDKLRPLPVPVLLVVNKVDRVPDKAVLLPHLQSLAEKMDFAQTIPLCAFKQADVDLLEEQVLALLPEGVSLFPEDQITDRSERFLAAELIREKLTRRLNQELPYALTVEIEQFSHEDSMLRIHGLIWVERPGQKAIVIGKNGEVLKAVGQQAREDMQRLFGQKVFLKLWVKVKAGWSDDERALRSLGYNEI